MVDENVQPDFFCAPDVGRHSYHFDIKAIYCISGWAVPYGERPEIQQNVPSKLKKICMEIDVGTPVAIWGNNNANDSDVTVRNMHFQFWEDLCFSGRKLLWQFSPQR